MPVTLNAVNCPLPPLPISVVFALDSRSAFGVPPMSDKYTQAMLGGGFTAAANYNAAVNDILAKYGSGTYAVIRGYDPTAGTGLNVDISAGHACITGLRESDAEIIKSVDPNIARIQLWLNTDGTITTVNNSLTPPAGEVCYLGSCVTDGSGVTSVDTSGVLFYRHGQIWRETADTGVPGDSPGTERRFHHRTASATYYWDGLSYLLLAGTTTRRDIHANKSAEADGDLFFPSDGLFLERYDGAAYHPYGPLYPLTQPPAAGSFVSEGAAMDIAIDSKGTVYFEKDENASDDFALMVTAETAPYTVEALFMPNMLTIGSNWAQGLVFFENATGKFVLFSIERGTVVIERWTDFQNVLSAQVFTAWADRGPVVSYKVEDDSTNLNFFFSADGQEYIPVYTMLRTTHFTTAPDRVGIGLNAVGLASPNSMSMSLLSWKVS